MGKLWLVTVPRARHKEPLQSCPLEIPFEIQPWKSKVLGGFGEVRRVRHEMK